MPARPLNFLWRFSKIPPIEWFIGRVDVVHGTNFVVPPARRAGTVVSVHDLTQIHYPELVFGGSPPFPELVRRAIGRGAWVHTDSDFVRTEVIASFDVDPTKVRTVMPGVPPLPDVAPEVARQVLQRMLPAGRSHYVLAIGTAEPRKDLPGLVRAFDQIAARHRELHLVLAGPPGWGDDALRDAIASARYGDRVIRTGWVDDLVLAALVRQASVLAYPSIYEGFGFPPLQAMSAGVPVVANAGGITARSPRGRGRAG